MTANTGIAAVIEYLTAFVPAEVLLVGLISLLLTLVYWPKLKGSRSGRGSKQKPVRVYKKVTETTYFH